jgi:predicted ATPase
MELQEDGGHLAGVLDQLRDREPERFETLNEELGRWLPEFDRILFDTPEAGQRVFLLRTRQGHHAIPAWDLSQGVRFALVLLTLAWLPDPPSIVCLEEPDRGMHPRLLRDVQDALYRLSYPENFGETRAPVQVLATTHSPYFLDLFKDHPEEVVIAHRVGQEARFERLSDRPDIDEILGSAPLGEVWYSGILGGVPEEQ